MGLIHSNELVITNLNWFRFGFKVSTLREQRKSPVIAFHTVAISLYYHTRKAHCRRLKSLYGVSTLTTILLTSI
nr:MAG TPA: hypothetical protein [Caudoviricetes sp.]